jgi:hypothetical protein
MMNLFFFDWHFGRFSSNSLSSLLLTITLVNVDIFDFSLSVFRHLHPSETKRYLQKVFLFLHL